MKFNLQSIALIISLLGSSEQGAALMIGDEVCVTGYVMDNFCIERGTLLDDPSTVTLEHPENHSYHCLLDVGLCYESGFQVLGGKDPNTGKHSLGYRLDDTETVLAAGRAEGQKGFCSTCKGDSSAPVYGYQATVKGIVSDLGDGTGGVTGTPILTKIEVMSADVECNPPPAMGDEVCITGYVVDNFCIERGTFLDNDSVMTLQHPEEHSFHCLLDVDVCRESGYQVIGEKNPDTGMHCLGFRLDDTDAVVAAGQAYGQEGYCTTCTGDSSAPEYGWAATIKGTISDMGDGSSGVTGTPILTDIQILSSNVACEKATIPPLCLAQGSGLTPIVPTTPVEPSTPVVPTPDVPVPTPVVPTPVEPTPVQPTPVEPTPVEPTPIAPTPNNQIPIVPTPSGEETGPPSAISTEANEHTEQDCSSDFCESQLADNYLLRFRINVPDGSDSETCEGCTITFQVVYDGEAWVGIAFSNDGAMIGSEAVIGIPGEVPLKYFLSGKSISGVQPMPEEQQTLTDATVQVTDGQTILEFTKIMAEPNEIEITTGDNQFLWAYGSSEELGYHAKRESSVQNFSTGASTATVGPNKAAWIAHGVMAFIAWGVLSPLAVESSLFRDLLGTPLWFRLHRAFNSISYALTVFLFSVAVEYYKKEGNTHFNGSHQKMGLAMFIMASIQVLGGIFRPKTSGTGEEKSSVREDWEYFHHVMGFALLGCGFWQMQAGIHLFVHKYSVSDEDNNALVIAYWVWIGIMIAALFYGLVGEFATYNGEKTGRGVAQDVSEPLLEGYTEPAQV